MKKVILNCADGIKIKNEHLRTDLKFSKLSISKITINYATCRINYLNFKNSLESFMRQSIKSIHDNIDYEGKFYHENICMEKCDSYCIRLNCPTFKKYVKEIENTYYYSMKPHWSYKKALQECYKTTYDINDTNSNAFVSYTLECILDYILEMCTNLLRVFIHSIVIEYIENKIDYNHILIPTPSYIRSWYILYNEHRRYMFDNFMEKIRMFGEDAYTKSCYICNKILLDCKC